MNGSQIKSVKIKNFLRAVAGYVKIRYFLKQDNCGCIMNNQLKFDIYINIFLFLSMSDYVNEIKAFFSSDFPEFFQTKNSLFLS